MSLWIKIKDSTLIKTLILYAGAFWGIIQVLDFLVERFHLPENWLLLVIIVGLTFIPCAVLLSVFTRDLKIQILSFCASALVAGFLIYYNLDFAPRSGLVQLAEEQKSIAVLPFTNLTNDPEQDYLTDGIAEEILNSLGKISDLQVKSRKSTLQYRNSEKPSREIGEELGVKSLLEGSIRKLGNRIRISVQLIDAPSEIHIWSESYDRVYDDILTLQSQISSEITTALKAKLTVTEQQFLKTDRNTHAEAYDYYLRAKYIFNNFSGNNEKEYLHARNLLLKALALDPNFAEAYSTLGSVLFTLRGFGVPRSVWLDSALLVTERSIELNPALPEGYLLRRWLSLNFLNKPDQAKNDLHKAYALSPNDPNVLRSLGYSNIRDGSYEDGAKMVVKAIELKYTRKDPEYYFSLVDLCIRSGEFEKAHQLITKVKELDPHNVSIYNYASWAYENYAEAKDILLQAKQVVTDNFYVFERLGWVYLKTGDLVNAGSSWGRYTEFEKTFKNPGQYLSARHRLGFIKLKLGEKEEAEDLFREQLQLDMEAQCGLVGNSSWESKTYFYDLCAVNSVLGKKYEALAWLDSAANRGFYWYWGIKNDPLLDNIRKEKKFAEITNRKATEFGEFKKAFERALEVY